MKTGRLLFTDLAQRAPRASTALIAYVLVIATAAIATLVYSIATRDDVVITAVHHGVVEARALPALDDDAQARIDGFRAGFATAIEQGCAQPVALQHPLYRP